LLFNNEKDFEVAQVAKTSLHLNSREVSIQLLMLWGPCSLSSLSAVVVRTILNLKGSRSKNDKCLGFTIKRCQPVNGDNDGGRAETEEPACFQYYTD